LKAVLADPHYVGLSATTIEGMIRAAAKSPGAAAQFGDGSAEQRLLARLAMRDKIEADYALQMRQMAVALAPMLGDAKHGGELTGGAKDMLASALQAAGAAAATLRVRHAAHGTPKVLPETLPAVSEAVDQAIASVAHALQEKAAPMAPTAAEPTASTSGAAELEGLAKAGSDEAGAVVPAAQIVAAAPLVAPAPAPRAAEAAKAAVVAVQAVRSGGMFGGVATVQRNPAEMDEANLVDDVFMEVEGENLVGG
jgi:hypothetical protein